MSKFEITLVMIVKNEEKVIKRAIESASRISKSFVICDTGSTDKTKDIIQFTTQQLGMKGKIYDCEWKNFGHNRSEALAKSRELYPNNYSFMLDADDTLEGEIVKPSFFKSQCDGYKITMKEQSTKYVRTQFFSNSKHWVYKGVLHEYPEILGEESNNIGMIPDSTYVISRREGSRSDDPAKYFKDALVLEEELKKEPENTRYSYYYAQSLKDSGQVEKAIKAFKDRIALNSLGKGWKEEAYVSYSHLVKLTSDLNEKVELAYKSIDINPLRLEAIYYALNASRNQSYFNQKLYALGLVVKNRRCRENFLFCEPDIYLWKFNDEMGIISYYTGHYQEALEFSTEAHKHCPQEHKERIKKNMDFARKNL
jgi:glycosyltransferase involved in cell wall biosynthesis